MTKATDENKAELERILTLALQKKEPPLARVLISDDGTEAILQVANKPDKRRKLSHYGKEFLQTGSVMMTEGESFLEPE